MKPVNKKAGQNESDEMFSAQGTQGETISELLSQKKAIEESVRMGGYDTNLKKTRMRRREHQQPTENNSEFWLG